VHICHRLDDTSRNGVPVWKLWLDDKIHDPDAPARHAPPGFLGAVNTADALALVDVLGPPALVDLDHDLGSDDDALVFLHALARRHPNAAPTWAIHSANPVGRERIETFMHAWHRACGEKR
jgi:hypothetical protein